MKWLSLVATLVAMALSNFSDAAEYNWVGQSNMINRSTGLEMNVGTYAPASYGYVSGMGSNCGCGNTSCGGGCGINTGCCETRPRRAYRLWSGHCAPKSCSPCAPEPTCCPDPCDPCGKPFRLFGGFGLLKSLHNSCCEPTCCPPAIMHHYRPVFNSCNCGCNPCQCRPVYGLFHGMRPRLFGGWMNGCCESPCGCQDYPSCGCGDSHNTYHGESWSDGTIIDSQPQQTPTPAVQQHEEIPQQQPMDNLNDDPATDSIQEAPVPPVDTPPGINSDDDNDGEPTLLELPNVPSSIDTSEVQETSAFRPFRSLLGY